MKLSEAGFEKLANANMCNISFYTLPHDSGRVLWFHIGLPCVSPSVVCPSVHFLFPDDSLSKHQWIYTKLGLYIDIVEIWFGIAYGQILSNFDSYLRHDNGRVLV